MASVKKIWPPTPPPPPTYQLELTQQEADDLVKLCGRIGGTPDDTIRETTGAIYDVLKKHAAGDDSRLKGVTLDARY